MQVCHARSASPHAGMSCEVCFPTCRRVMRGLLPYMQACHARSVSPHVSPPICRDPHTQDARRWVRSHPTCRRQGRIVRGLGTPHAGAMGGPCKACAPHKRNSLDGRDGRATWGFRFGICGRQGRHGRATQAAQAAAWLPRPARLCPRTHRRQWGTVCCLQNPDPQAKEHRAPGTWAPTWAYESASHTHRQWADSFESTSL